jgi:hypothetical protein
MDGCQVGRGEGQQMAVICGFDAKLGVVFTVFLAFFYARVSLGGKTILHVHASKPHEYQSIRHVCAWKVGGCRIGLRVPRLAFI